MRKIIIIDDFYSDPDAVRDYALRSAYVPKGQGTYPGQNSVETYAPPELDETLIRHIGERVIPLHGQSAHGRFRLHYLNDPFQQLIHADNGTDWGGVLYLNPGNPPGGTTFWKHKETGLKRFPKVEDFARAKVRNFEEAHTKFSLTDGLDPNLWELEFTCEAKYNRLVLFPSTFYHAHAPVEGFGTTPQDARLVQLFFFRKQ